jgi:rod shape-determining protein MreD
MTPRARLIAGLALALFVAAVAQAALAGRVRLWEAQPNFLLAVALIGALFCNTGGGAGVGFAAGLLSAALASPPRGGFGSLLVSCTLVCGSLGWLEERLFRDHPAIALAGVTVGTAAVEGLFYLFAPQPYPLHWARMLGLTTLYNAVLAIPLYLLIRGLIGARRDSLFGR